VKTDRNGGSYIGRELYGELTRELQFAGYREQQEYVRPGEEKEVDASVPQKRK